MQRKLARHVAALALVGAVAADAPDDELPADCWGPGEGPPPLPPPPPGTGPLATTTVIGSAETIQDPGGRNGNGKRKGFFRRLFNR